MTQNLTIAYIIIVKHVKVKITWNTEHKPAIVQP